MGNPESQTNDSEIAGIQLAEFLEALRDQLKAAKVSADPDLPIEVGPVTVEFSLTTRREGTGKAGVKFWVVDAGGSATVGRDHTQKITMQLIPRGPGGRGPATVRDMEHG